jgi:predicted alpha/beta superfamily hydrolase
MPTEPVIPNDQTQPSAPGSLAARVNKHQEFVSRLVEEHHDLVVYLPPMYEAEGERRFPVLYMQDGQNLFDPETSFIKGNYWRLGETADALAASCKIEPLIIVGIYNSGLKRLDEYTPVEDKRLGGGHADDYGHMLVQELKPFIDAQYRTLPGPEDTGLGGSSLGGLVTLHLGLQHPSVFSRLAVMSPSIWWRNRIILKTVAEIVKKPGLSIWLDMGTRESTRGIADAQLLRDGLVKKGWQLGEDLAYCEAEGAEHTESAWAERAGPMLSFLFPAGRS